MGFADSRKWFELALLPLLLVPVLTGCQSAPALSTRRLIAHQAMIDFSGLKSPQSFSLLHMQAAVPQNWVLLPVEDKTLYVHQQWRSLDHNTGVGVAYIHLPFPVSPRLIVWFAKLQYARQTTADGKPQGQLLNQWTDSLGREWFEAENEKFHIKGYALTSNFNAWIVYNGYRLHSPPNPPDINLSNRSMESVLPIP